MLKLNEFLSQIIQQTVANEIQKLVAIEFQKAIQEHDNQLSPIIHAAVTQLVANLLEEKPK
jgi:Na+-transporting methylmalonyl-CoA/oxaloacetate decarboxylase gamma subunit